MLVVALHNVKILLLCFRLSVGLYGGQPSWPWHIAGGKHLQWQKSKLTDDIFLPIVPLLGDNSYQVGFSK